MLWYGAKDEQERAIGILQMLGNERAVAALQAFALSQVGDDDLRMTAAIALLDLGTFSEDEPVRLWLKGQWREVLLRRQLITEEWELEYSDEVMALLDGAIKAFQAGKEEEAEQLYQKMIALEPNAKQGLCTNAELYRSRISAPHNQRQNRAIYALFPHQAPKNGLLLSFLGGNCPTGATVQKRLQSP
jgi:hypothetical protein